MTDNSGKLFARYCFEKSKIKKSGLHHRLFHPKDDRLSVQLIDDIQTQQIEIIGREIGIEQGRNLYGWGQVSRSVFEKEGLRVCVDNDPRPGHTNIRGWPKDPDVLLDVRQKLAVAANVVGAVYVSCCTTA